MVKISNVLVSDKKIEKNFIYEWVWFQTHMHWPRDVFEKHSKFKMILYSDLLLARAVLRLRGPFSTSTSSAPWQPALTLDCWCGANTLRLVRRGEASARDGVECGRVEARRCQD